MYGESRQVMPDQKFTDPLFGLQQVTADMVHVIIWISENADYRNDIREVMIQMPEGNTDQITKA